MRYFSPDTTKEQDVSDSKDDEKDDEEAPFDPVESLGIFCANLDITKQHNPHTVMQFYSRMLNRAKLTVGRRSEFQSHWEQFKPCRSTRLIGASGGPPNAWILR